MADNRVLSCHCAVVSWASSFIVLTFKKMANLSPQQREHFDLCTNESNPDQRPILLGNRDQRWRGNYLKVPKIWKHLKISLNSFHWSAKSARAPLNRLMSYVLCKCHWTLFFWRWRRAGHCNMLDNFLRPKIEEYWENYNLENRIFFGSVSLFAWDNSWPSQCRNFQILSSGLVSINGNQSRKYWRNFARYGDESDGKRVFFPIAS